jgi:diacylglycerol kinase (ATP)
VGARKATLISNPRTGRYNARRIPIEHIASLLRSRGVEVDLKPTTAPHDATAIAARAARNGSSEIIVAGGDGTINEVIQGVAGTKARLGIIPRGTANVLARELGLPLDEQEAAVIAARGNSRRIHLGLAIDETNNVSRHFALMAGSHLASWSPHPFKLEIDGREYTATFAAIGKAPRYGGDLAITPEARLDEPEFEVCIIETSNRFRYLRLLSYAMRAGMPRDNPAVRFIKTNKVLARGNAPVQIDGELIGSLPMRFEIAPDSLEVIVP